MELLNNSKLHKFLNDSIKYKQILSFSLILGSNKTRELTYDIRRSSDYTHLIYANKIDRFDISKYCNRKGFSKTKLRFIHAFFKKFPERIQDQRIQNWFGVS
jgi:hypothetical protein